MDKKKVIFILFSLAVGGAERRAATIANYLVNHGFELDILLLDSPEVRFSIDSRIRIVYLCDDSSTALSSVPENVNVFYSKKHSASISHQIRLKISKLLNKRKYKAYDQLEYLINRYSNKILDYIKSRPDFTVISWMTPINISTCYALRKQQNELILVECTSPEFEYEKDHPITELRKEYYSLANKCICQTTDSVEYYSFLSKVKKYIIPNPIIGNYPQRYNGTRKKRVVTFARLSKVKNIPLLIGAFQLFHHDYPDYELHIFGEGSEKENLISYVSDLGLSDYVTFFAFDVNIHSRIVDYSMYVSSSDREGMSNSMLEAMAIGLPTISTDCPAGAARMLIENYVNGIVVPMRDPEAMYEAMKYIAEHPDEAKKMSEKAIEIKEKLSINNIGELWIKALTD